MKYMPSNAWRDRIKVDFSADSHLKEALRERLLLEIGRQPDDPRDMKEAIPMKRTLKYSTRVALIALLSIVLAAGVALAALKTFSLGPFAAYSLIEEQEAMEQAEAFVNAHRADWEGKLFDADGHLIDDLTAYIMEHRDQTRVFDAQGVEQTLDMSDDAITIRNRQEMEDATDAIDVTSFAGIEEVKPLLGFEFALPTYLPAGYTLDRFEIFNDGDGKPVTGSKYLTVVFAKPGAPDSELNMLLRLMDEDTAFEAGGPGTIRELMINGHAAVTDGNSIDMLAGDVMYMFLPGRSGVALDELVKMAESIAP